MITVPIGMNRGAFLMQYLMNMKYQRDVTHISYDDNYLKPVPTQVALHDIELNRIPNKLPNEINLFWGFYHGKHKAITYTTQLNLWNYLFMYKVDTHALNEYYYKLLITFDPENIRYIHIHKGTKIIDCTGSNVYLNLKKSLSKLRNNVISKDTHVSFLTNHIATKYPLNVHTHGLIYTNIHSNTYINHLSNHWGSYLSNQLGFQVNVSLTPLMNYSTHTQVHIDSNNCMNRDVYQPIQQYLMYIYKSYKLAFMWHKLDFQEWNLMEKQQTRNYVLGVILSTRNIRLSYSYSLVSGIKRVLINELGYLNKIITSYTAFEHAINPTTSTITNDYSRLFITKYHRDLLLLNVVQREWLSNKHTYHSTLKPRPHEVVPVHTGSTTITLLPMVEIDTSKLTEKNKLAKYLNSS